MNFVNPWLSIMSFVYFIFAGFISFVISLFFRKKRFLSPVDAIKIMVDLADQIQHISRQSLPDKVVHLKDAYLSKSMDMVAAGLDVIANEGYQFKEWGRYNSSVH